MARRGVGSTFPNPPVGAVIVREGRTIGEGYHRIHGGPHAEVEAIEDARRRGHLTEGATMYVTLEPCDHQGRTPPCSQAVIAADIARVVIGVADPNPRTNGAGIRRLKDAGIEVAVAGNSAFGDLIEAFRIAVRLPRPYVTLKMAAPRSTRYVAPSPGTHWLTGESSRERVREMRWAHDAILVGGGTIRIDDPLLTVRPLHARRRPYVRVVACGKTPPSADAAVFRPQLPAEEFARTIILAPGAYRKRFESLEGVADCLYAGDLHEQTLDLQAGLVALKERGISSILCEGGPILAGALMRRGLVDRLVWFVAPDFLHNARAVPALAGEVWDAAGDWTFAAVQRCGKDLMITAKPATCSAA